MQTELMEIYFYTLSNAIIKNYNRAYVLLMKYNVFFWYKTV
jgi:hypothetical protein